MKAGKLPFAIIIIAGFLAVLAFLHQIVSCVLDGKTEKQPSYNDMHSVSLDINNGEATLTYKQMIALLADAKTVDLSPDQTTMTEQEVNAAVTKFLEECEEAGIFEQFTPTHCSILPKLLYDPSDFSKHLVVWTVTMTNKKSPNQALLLDVDDDTGKILCVSYDIYRSYTMENVWEQNKTLLECFTDLYFAQFEMAEAAEAARSGAFTDSGIYYEYKEVDGGVTEVIYSFSDAEYGVVQIQFIVNGAGGFMITYYK